MLVDSSYHWLCPCYKKEQVRTTNGMEGNNVRRRRSLSMSTESHDRLRTISSIFFLLPTPSSKGNAFRRGNARIILRFTDEANKRIVEFSVAIESRSSRKRMIPDVIIAPSSSLSVSRDIDEQSFNEEKLS